MQYLSDLAGAAAAPFVAVAHSGTSRNFWLYLVGALLAALILFCRGGGRGVRSFLRFLVPEGTLRHRSAAVDVMIVALNAVLLALPGLLATATAAALADPAAAAPAVPLWFMAAYTLALFLADDFIHFWLHLMFHRVPLLWSLHKVHHSAEVLTPVTSERFHPLEVMITATFHGTAFVLVTAAFLSFQDVSPLTIFGANALLVLFNVFAGTLRHSHVWFPFTPRLSRWLVSPAMHQIHHSAEERHWDKNMGGSLAIWDRLWGTLYVPEEREDFRLGIGDETVRFRSLAYCYLSPIAEAWRLTVRRLRPRRKPIAEEPSATQHFA